MYFCEDCEIGTYFSYCYCKKTKELCPFVRKCSNEHRWKPLDSMERCTLRRKDDCITLRKGEYKVSIVSKGYLFVKVDDNTTIKIRNPFDSAPDKVELVKVGAEYYIKGYEPKIEKDFRKSKKEMAEDE